MRILVENSGYDLLNHGDAAMLQVAVRRLADAFPGADVEVLTARPDRLAALCPGARPVPVRGRSQWRAPGSLFGRLSVARPELERRVRVAWPAQAHALQWARWRLRGRDTGELDAFVRALLRTDLLFLSGGGYLTDEFAGHARAVLETLRIAQRAGTPTVMAGQGIGPLESPALRALAAEVLPRVALIGVREGRTAPALLRGLGVAEERIVVTGDDAVGPAYDARAAESGDGIGVNVRVASYAGVDAELLKAVGEEVAALARRCAAPLVPIPIALADVRASEARFQEPDLRVARRMAEEAGGELDAREGPATPREVIAEVGKCRVVVTGSYHAAVFALSRGVPAVCLARSTYYLHKFEGLAEQFGDGCTVVRLDREGWREELRRAALRAWESGREAGPGLLRAARRQVEEGDAFYRRVSGLLAARRQDSIVSVPEARMVAT